MATGTFGVDSSWHKASTSTLNTITEHNNNPKPSFWGRYFKSKETISTLPQYDPTTENTFLNKNQIHLLPIGRQTNHVGGSKEQGQTDAQHNIDALFGSISPDYLATQGGQFLIFLDVEGVPSMSATYYDGWANTILSYSESQSQNRVQIQPCVYARPTDAKTWQAIGSQPCYGAWTAVYLHGSSHYCEKPMPDWDTYAKWITPDVTLNCKTLLCQYTNACYGGVFDLNQTNPNIDLQADFLNKLILPPA